MKNIPKIIKKKMYGCFLFRVLVYSKTQILDIYLDRSETYYVDQQASL